MQRGFTVVAVGLFCLAVVSGTAVGQASGFTFTTTAGDAQPGEDVTVTFTYENTGEETDTAVVNVTSIPDGWEIADRSDDGGTWSSGDQTWLYISVSSGSSVSPSLTLSVPADADGTYNVTALGTDDSETVESNVTFEFGTDGESSTESMTDMTAIEGDGTGTDGTETDESMDEDGTATESMANDTAEETATGADGAGFGVVVTSLAVLCLGLLARRRR